MKQLISLLILLLTTMTIAQLGDSSIVAKFEKHTFTHDTTALNYRLFKPFQMNEDSKYPLILTLHGSGERGGDNEKQVLWHGIATAWADSSVQERNPSFILSPQCPEENQWVDSDWDLIVFDQDTIAISNELITVYELVSFIIKKYPVDNNRIYITGLSMGADGTWDFITRYPDLFAAAIPMSGGGDPDKMELIKDLPLWVFHGALDKAVPVESSRVLVKSLRKHGSDVIYTELKYGEHIIWKPLYENRLLQDWLFNQRN